MGLLGDVIGAAGSIIGGNISANNANKIAAMNAAMQKEFAQNGIRWKVEDAKRAGIHPLFALGANTSQFTPVGGYSGDYGIGDALSSMGQSIDRAKQAKMTPAERAVEQMKADKAYDLDIRQKEANITATMAQASYYARLGQQQLPSLPGVSDFMEGQNTFSSGVTSTNKEIQPMYQLFKDGRGYQIYPNSDLMDMVSESTGSRVNFWSSVATDLALGKFDLPKLPSNKEYKLFPFTGRIEVVDKKYNKKYTTYDSMYKGYY